MKQKILLTENELIEVIDSILESRVLNQYDEEDFIDVFLEIFKPWVRNKLGELAKKYAISHLIKKYYDEFLEDLDIPNEGYDWMNLSRKMARAGREIVEKGIYKLPSMQPEELFSKKNEKILNFLVKNKSLPSWVKVSFEEDEPYELRMKIGSDWQQMILSDENQKPIRFNNIYEDITKTIESYLGIETQGKPINGELNMTMSVPEMQGVEEWVKNILNKEIKKELKQSPVGKFIHSISFKPNSNRSIGEFKIKMKSHSSWSQQNPVREQLKGILKNKGYNLKFFNIEI
jgi:hypothetical protein